MIQSIEYVYDIIQELRSTSKRNEKIDILTKYKDDAALKTYIYLTIEPTLAYYQTDIEADESIDGAGELTLETLTSISKRLTSRELSGNAAIEEVKRVYEGLSIKSKELFKNFILKDIKAGVGEGTVNKVWDDLITDPAYMRYELVKGVDLDKFDWKTGCYVQMKMDALFGRISILNDNSVVIESRNGSLYPNESFADMIHLIQSKGLQNKQLHGEIMIRENGEILPRAISNGIINSVQQGGSFEKTQTPIFVVWDIIPLENSVSKKPYKVPYSERFEELNNVFEPYTDLNPDLIMVVETTVVHSYAESLKVYTKYTSRGLEGCVVKSPNMIWKNSTTKEAFKLKVICDIDLRIVGFERGDKNGKYANTLGTVKCESECGLLKVDVSGWRDADRDEIFNNQSKYEQKIVTVTANDLLPPSESNDNWTLFHPRSKMVNMRFDKDVADDLDRIKMIFDSAKGIS